MAIYDEVRGGYRVFIGDLGSRIDRNDLDREFKYFGTLLDVWVARNPPGFGFVVFKNADDAERAVKKLHGRSLCGRRVRVEHAFETGAKERRMAETVRFRGGSSRRSRSRSRDRRRSPSYESLRRSTTSRRRSPSDELRTRSSRSKRQSPEFRQRSDRSRSHSIPRNSHRRASRSSEGGGDRSLAKKNHRDSASASRSRSRSATRKKAGGDARSHNSDD